MSAAVPGEIKGYHYVKLKHGNPNVTWASLIEPSIKMCREGIPVTKSAADVMKKKIENIFKDPGMR